MLQGKSAPIETPARQAISLDLEQNLYYNTLSEFTISLLGAKRRPKVTFVRMETACGIPLFVDRDKEESAFSMLTLVNIGSADELTLGLKRGIAHFFEHMVFETTEEFPNLQTLASLIEDVGGEIDAGTDLTTTVYWSTAPKRSVRKAVKNLHQMICKPVFRKDSIKRVTLEIKQEVDENWDDPKSCLDEFFRATLFAGHPLSNTYCWKSEDLESITVHDLRRFHRSFYHPRNIIFIVAGGIRARTIRRIIDEFFTEDWTSQFAKIPPPLPLPQETQNKSATLLRRDLRNAYVAIGNWFPEAHKRNGVVAEVFAMMLNGIGRTSTNFLKGGFSFPMTQCFRDSGLSYSLNIDVTYWRNIGEFVINIYPKPHRVEEAIEQTQKLIDRVKSDPILLARAKKAATYNFDISPTSVKDRVESASDEIQAFGIPIPSEKRNREIKSVRISEIRRFVDEYLSPQKLVTAIIKPPSIENLTPLA